MYFFWSYRNKQYGITKIVHILSCSVEYQSSNEGEKGLSVLSTTQITQTMTGEQTGTWLPDFSDHDNNAPSYLPLRIVFWPGIPVQKDICQHLLMPFI